MDEQRFLKACATVKNSSRARNGIGTLSEKTLHAVLKEYFDPCRENQEVRLAPYVADIVTENGIIEIQTGGFDKLRRKLKAFLDITTVTVAYPIALVKWLIWIDETGKMSKKRKSPKHGTPYEVFYELYKIKPLLTHPNFRLCIVMLELEEYRYLNGWSDDKKKGSSRCDRIPIQIQDEIYIENRWDYNKLIPDSLDAPFTTKDYQHASGLSLARSQTALNVLYSVGAVRRSGKTGKLYLYEREV